MKTITDLKDVPAGTAMTILQDDGTYLCVSKIERPDVDVAVEPVKSAIVREIEASPLMSALVEEIAVLKKVSKEDFIASVDAKVSIEEPMVAIDG